MTDQSSEDDENQKDLSSSMNPLKSHYGIDLGLPKPLSKLLYIILFLVVTIVRLTIYATLALISFATVYVLTMGVYCPFIYSGEVIACVETQYASPVVLAPGLVFATVIVGIVALLDYKKDFRKYF